MFTIGPTRVLTMAPRNSSLFFLFLVFLCRFGVFFLFVYVYVCFCDVWLVLFSFFCYRFVSLFFFSFLFVMLLSLSRLPTPSLLPPSRPFFPGCSFFTPCF